MAETKNQEWNISHTTAPQDSSTAQPTTNTEWNVDQPTAAPLQSAAQPASQQWNIEDQQQWNIEAQQWNVNQPVVPQKEQQEIKEQWNMSEPAAQLESSPQPPDALWNVAQPEPSPKSNEPTSQQWGIDQPPPPQGVVPPQKDETAPIPPQPQTSVTEKPSLQSASKVIEEPDNEQEKQPVIAQPKPAVMPQEKPTTPEIKDAQSAVVTTQPQAPQRTVVQSSSQQEPVVPKQPVPPPATVTEPMDSKQSSAPQETVAQTTLPPKQPVPSPATVAEPVSSIQPPAPQETVAQPMPPKQPVVAAQEIVAQPVNPKQPAAPQETKPMASQATVTLPTAPQQPNVSQATVVQPMAPKQQTVSKQTVMQQITPQKPTPQTRTVVQSTTQVSMQPKTSHQSVAQTTQQSSNAQQPMAAQGAVTQPTVGQAAPPPASTPPVVKPKPSTTDNQDQMRRGGGDETTLEELQKGVFWLAPDLEGWVDKTKALKEEFRRQSDANEMYFVKNLPHLDVKALNISEDPSKYIYNVQDMRGVEVINLLRCVINEYREFESGPFFFQFGDDKKIKLELLPTATQPGNGLIKTVGRRKYYSYPDMCSMLHTAGVNSKGLGIMLQKLNTSGLKSALNNKISPINELHFMLLFEVARRLVRGPHGFSMASEPEIDQLPIAVAVSRMITMFCKGNYCLNYEAVFGTQDKYNPFIDTSVVLRRQKIYALNKLFYDAEIRSQAGDNPFLAKFLKYHNGYIIKTVNGFMEELDMAFRGF